MHTVARDAMAMSSTAQDKAAQKQAVGGAIEGFASAIRKAGEDLSESDQTSLGRSADELQDRASDMASQTKEKVSDMKNQISDTVAQAREAGRSAAGKLGSKTENTARLAQDTGRWLSQIVGEAVQEEPLILGAVGLAVGFAIGVAVPRTSVAD